MHQPYWVYKRIIPQSSAAPARGSRSINFSSYKDSFDIKQACRDQVFGPILLCCHGTSEHEAVHSCPLGGASRASLLTHISWNSMTKVGACMASHVQRVHAAGEVLYPGTFNRSLSNWIWDSEASWIQFYKSKCIRGTPPIWHAGSLLNSCWQHQCLASARVWSNLSYCRGLVVDSPEWGKLARGGSLHLNNADLPTTARPPPLQTWIDILGAAAWGDTALPAGLLADHNEHPRYMRMCIRSTENCYTNQTKQSTEAG